MPKTIEDPSLKNQSVFDTKLRHLKEQNILMK